MEFSLSWDPLTPRQVAFGLEAWADLVSDFSLIFDRIAGVFRSHEAKHMRTEGLYTGPRFVELSDAYKAWKDERFPGMPILQRTGAMFNALTTVGARGNVSRIGARVMEVGIDGEEIPYAEAHALGLGVPVRRPVEITGSLRGGHGAGASRSPDGLVGVIQQLFQAYVVWCRKAALRKQQGASFADPFLDERFGARVVAIAAMSTGDESALDRSTQAALAELGLSRWIQ